MQSTYVETWKAIGLVLGRSERWCRYMARGGDPLPVFKVGGIVRLNRADLAAWLERVRDRSIARPSHASHASHPSHPSHAAARHAHAT